jgi:pyrimidine 5'-nucleotidase
MKYSFLFIDLDDTVYSHDCGLWDEIKHRINLYMHECLHLSWEEIPDLRTSLLRNYGTTMRGLSTLYDIDQEDFLQYVHNVPLNDYIKPDPELKEILQSYPQRKAIFTNADAAHAKRVTSIMGIQDCFEEIIDIHAISPHCKPQPEAYQIALRQVGETKPSKCVMMDDSSSNLLSAKDIGFFTIRVGSDEPCMESHASISSLKHLYHVLER